MISGAVYGHTNLIAHDWRALSRFYQDLFGCIPVPPERDFKGPDLERGTGISGAAWASEMTRVPRVTGVDRNPWAVSEARWTYNAFGLEGTGKTLDLNTFRAPAGMAIVAAFILNELPEESRERWRSSMLSTAERGFPVLVIEPIAKKLSPWWDDWARDFKSAGGRSDEWRFPVTLPERLALMDKAAGLDHRELTGR